MRRLKGFAAGAAAWAAWSAAALAADAPPGSLSGKVVILPVSDQERFMVDEGLYQFLKRRIEEAEHDGAKALVLEMDTYGGEVHAALKISDLLLNTRIPRTVAFVRTKAISAGALIALSCKEIVMNPNTTIGDCEPILQTGQGLEYGPEKFKTALRARFRLFDYPAAIGEGMVDKEIEVYEVQVDGATRYITNTDLENLKRAGKEPATSKVIKPKGQLLTVTAEEAARYRLAKHLVEDRPALLRLYGWSDQEAVYIEPTWSETLSRWVTSPMVAGLLLLVGMIAIYVAMNHPGLGIPEVLVALCFGLLFGGKYMAGLAESWEILLFFVGVLLILVELFVLPGTGFFGIAGAGLMIVALFLAFLPSVTPPPVPATPPGPPDAPREVREVMEIRIDWGYWLKQTAWVVFGGMFGALLGILAIIRWMGQIPMMNRMILTAAVTGEAGPVSMMTMAAPVHGADPQSWIGRQGMTLTTLRPSGRIEIEGTTLDVSSEGDYLDRGALVRVTRVEGMNIFVRKV